MLCMAPTEYRVIAKRATLRPIASLRGLVAAGEALNPEVLRAWEEATGLQIRDGYGQTETGQLTGMPPGEAVRPGSMGRALPGIALSIDDGELVVDPATVPTFFLRYGGDGARAAGRPVAHRRPRQPRRGRLPVLRGPHRRRDHLRRLPDRPLRGRVGARRARGGRRGGGRRGARRGARLDRARGRRAARRLRGVRRPRPRAAGPRQGPDRALQVPAPGRLRRRAAQDGERQGAPRAAARRRRSIGLPRTGTAAVPCPHGHEPPPRRRRDGRTARARPSRKDARCRRSPRRRSTTTSRAGQTACARRSNAFGPRTRSCSID